jgi:hypothetical protein
VLFFAPIVLDTPARFAAGCAAVFLLGFGVEAVGFLRRRREKALRRALRRSAAPKDAGPSLARARAERTAMFAAQLTGAYLAMLVAMMYETHLFVLVVLGLAAGHIVFQDEPGPPPQGAASAPDGDFPRRLQREDSASGSVGVEPCCAVLEAEDDDSAAGYAELSDQAQTTVSLNNNNNNNNNTAEGASAVRAHDQH